jgi:phenylacetate-coenzyme A ligase PaaK-like adenylate-forming protein
MQFIKSFKQSIFQVTEANFAEHALALFRFQAEHNPVYAQYLAHLGVAPGQVATLEQVPFLPIEFFKHHRVLANPAPPTHVFASSGTTGAAPSQHYVCDLPFYEQVSANIFNQFYGPLDQYHVLALLPSYLERNNSSLVFMVDHFMRHSAQPSGFYLHNTAELAQQLARLRHSSRKILLIGVTFALLDFAEQYPGRLPANAIVMETGGMKGRRRELVRDEVHQLLGQAFGVAQVHSEYGMTELFSQCYAHAGGEFAAPPWARVLLRDLNDPFDLAGYRRDGGLNIVDLANVDSCAFIETQDIGARGQAPGSFRVLGRSDNADLRGCNLLLANG